MVWVLLLSMATPNGGGVAIEKFAYYSTEDECIKARTIFGKDGKSQTPRIPLALCVPVESPRCRRWGGRNMGGVVSGVFNLESSGVSASDWRPRHDKHYHEA